MVAGLQIDNLSVRYAARSETTPALRHLSLTLPPGSSVGICGDSGSGKTTLARSIPRLLPASASTSGSIRFDGSDLLQYSSEQLRSIRGCALATFRRNRPLP
ncbi:MAG: ATP-binding cassette domain-containing protein [Bryobacterales bacterium]|nr:ATP-binding cassette domain-containing protein [Bryobacterales bacterium]